jgi:hypothetical protein
VHIFVGIPARRPERRRRDQNVVLGTRPAVARPLVASIAERPSYQWFLTRASGDGTVALEEGDQVSSSDAIYRW